MKRGGEPTIVSVFFCIPRIEQKNGRRLLGTTLLKGDERRHVLLRGGEETRLGGMIVKWQNGTDRQIDRYIDEKRASQTPTLRVAWCKSFPNKYTRKSEMKEQKQFRPRLRFYFRFTVAISRNAKSI
jgi:hypothetical protein